VNSKPGQSRKGEFISQYRLTATLVNRCLRSYARNQCGPPSQWPQSLAVQAPSGVAVQLVHGSHTYRSYNDDADNDPYGGQYGTIVTDDFTVPVAPAAAGALAPQELAARVDASTQQPGTPNAFLLLC
jgi:hypothetical protein